VIGIGGRHTQTITMRLLFVKRDAT
jgi:hypothetical protein